MQKRISRLAALLADKEANQEKSAARNKRPDSGASYSISAVSVEANCSTMLALEGSALRRNSSMGGGTSSGQPQPAMKTEFSFATRVALFS
ncbi:MAG TPA: hypothetical protein VGP09_05335, partial [Caballeronia sp.]|nr:hypothetical protein [Caballeronia sp.]